MARPLQLNFYNMINNKIPPVLVKILLIIVSFLFLFIFFIEKPNFLSPEDTNFYRAKIIEIKEEGKIVDPYGVENIYQDLKIKILNGPNKSEEIEIRYGELLFSILSDNEKVKEKELVIIKKINLENGPAYDIYDKYRLRPLLIIIAIFFSLIVWLVGIRGVGSILSLFFSIIVVVSLVMPYILIGSNPLYVCLVGSLIIIVPSMYLGHGFNKRTSIALLSTLIAIVLAVILSEIFVSLTKLGGVTGEDAYYLQRGLRGLINLKGLLLGGIIIGTLGVIDDITINQTVVVDELRKTNPSLNFKQLYNKSLVIGKEHIISMVNTLALAYVGITLPGLLIFILNKGDTPLWVLINNEWLAEEMIRTLVGSVVLFSAVPISAFLAVYFLHFRRNKK